MRQFRGKNWNIGSPRDVRTKAQRIKDFKRPPTAKQLEQYAREKKAMHEALKKIEARFAERTSVPKNNAIKQLNWRENNE